uniref:CSD domain-containing protein n=1 Tax=Alexandrium monilatum TaxID=311494 RepID=A0A7S4WAU1_9DINO|eukprot:CAMPEP_0175183548 /NCGR_PEP_ID=MMETSP0093-20121207/910_1 /TAXON_ID=311494 /ORGANISM="Alexandrium monilatum, Strain CCMP3105" /LENGTH=457 /DNA_ID=CAMNT_0016476197 /DNA_START=64 /DNA_END=1437 /DNA_ORIENTATION=+
MPSGTVKKWVEEKGFGFILPDDSTQDVFAHRSALVGLTSLSPGNRVTYDIKDDGKGRGKFKAVNIAVTGNGRSPDGHHIFSNLPLGDTPPSTSGAEDGVDFFLHVAGAGQGAKASLEPFIVKSSVGCPFLVISDQQLVSTVPAPLDTEFRHLLGLANAYATGCDSRFAVLLARFEGEMLGHGGELVAAMFQMTRAVDTQVLAPLPMTLGMPTAMGLLVDMRSEPCLSIVRHIMTSVNITKVMWDALPACESLMYQQRPLLTGIRAAAVVDAKKAFRDLPMSAMWVQVPKRLLSGLPRRDHVDTDALQAGNHRVIITPLSSRCAAHALDDIHRMEAIIRSKVPTGGLYAPAQEATDVMLSELVSDPHGLRSLGQQKGWFEASSGARRTAHAVAIQRHIISLRNRRADLGAEQGVVEEMETEVVAALVRAGVTVPEDLSFSATVPCPSPQPLGNFFPWQ